MSFRVRSFLLLLTLVCTAALQAAKPQLQTRTFKVAPDFLFCAPPSDSGPAIAAADPFAITSPATTPVLDAPPPRPKTPRQTLEASGITFPDGASASFNPLSSQLTVTNSQPNLDLTEAYVEALQKLEPATVAFTLTVIEGPGELIRQANAAASKTTNAYKQLSALLDQTKQPDSKVRVVADSFLETKSGIRATIEAVRERTHPTEFSLDAQSRSSIATEMRQIGLRLEIEPTIGSDGATIDTTLSLTLNATPPTQRQLSVDDPVTGHTVEFPVTDIPATQFTTGLSIIAGSTKLIGITKPVGTPQENADILCAAFLTATLRRVAALPMPQPKVAAPSSVPPGMIFAALHAPDGLFDEALHGTKPVTLQSWLAQTDITFPPGSSIEHRGGMLRLINTTDNIALIAAIIDQLLSLSPKTVACTLHTFEAPAPFLRELTRQTLAIADDSAMLAAVEAAVARDEATCINSTFLETKSGFHASHHSAREHRYLDGFGTNAQGRPDLSFTTQQVGSLLEVEPVVGADSRTVELTLSHELHPTSPLIHREHFRDPASQQPFDIPLTDFNVHKTLTSLSITKGGTKLISLNQPTGRDKPGVLLATFLKCDVVSQLAKSRPIKAGPEPHRKPSADPKAIHTRAFRVPPDFLSAGGGSTSADGKNRPRTARTILEAAGIPFHEGTAAYYGPPTSQMVVTNTNENLDLIQTYVDSILFCPQATITFTTHVLQGPGPLLRRLTAQAASKSDHHAELDELLAAVKAGTVQHLNAARIETKSGTRATSTQATQYPALSSVSVNDKGESFFTHGMRNVGLTVELEPTVGADGVTIELTLAPEFHTAPPLEHREHIIDTQGRRLEFPLTDYFTAQLTTGITLPDGTTRLLSLYKPTGKPEFEKEDILQAIFITCDILRAGE